MRKAAPLLLLLAAAFALFFLLRKPSASGPDKTSGPSASDTAVLAGNGPSSRPGVAGKDDKAGPAQLQEANGKPLFNAKWGSGDGELGHERPQEGAPTGPMSLSVDSKGRVVVLDSVNGRLVRQGEGGKPEPMKIGLMDPQDMAAGQDGSTAVLDRFADKKVAVYDESGNLRGELPLEGEGVEDVGSVTGVFVDGEAVYVEKEHGSLVQIGTTSGQPVEPRQEIPGRPSRDGLSFIKAGIVDAQEGRVYVASIDRATVKQRFTRELRLQTFVRAIVLLDTDKTGTIYFATEIDQGDGTEAILLNCLDPLKGVVVGSALLPANTMPEETFRDFAVLDEGGVVYALRTEQGVSYIKYDCE
jgi:hypothetical protein